MQENTLQTDTDITPEQLERYYDAEFETYLEEHEGASFHTLFAHDDHGLIGFSVYTMPGDCDLRIAYTEWETEPHHELGTVVYVRRDAE